MQNLASLLQMAALYSSRTRAGALLSTGISNRPVPQSYVPKVDDAKPESVLPKGDRADIDPTRKSDDSNKTYYFQKKTRLDYLMNLRFNLGAFTQTVEKISDGDVTTLDEFVAAGFGLSADLKFKGLQEISTDMTESELGENLHSKSVARSRVSARMAALVASGDKAYALSTYYKEAESVRQTMNVSEHNGHRQAVSTFAARYTLDTRFSFAFLQRFNTQTATINEKAPEQVGNYVTSASGLAEQGSPQLMATFFDAVDSYLSDAEKQLAAKAEEFFSLAAAEMGLSGDLASVAKDQLLDKIEGFFNRVEAALDQVESRFVTSPAPGPQPTPEVPAPESTNPLPQATASSFANQIATA